MQTYKVWYKVLSLATRETVAVGSLLVPAESEGDAGLVATKWVHDNDPYCDDRIDPLVQVRVVRPTEKTVDQVTVVWAGLYRRSRPGGVR